MLGFLLTVRLVHRDRNSRHRCGYLRLFALRGKFRVCRVFLGADKLPCAVFLLAVAVVAVENRSREAVIVENLQILGGQIIAGLHFLRDEKRVMGIVHFSGLAAPSLVLKPFRHVICRRILIAAALTHGKFPKMRMRRRNAVVALHIASHNAALGGSRRTVYVRNVTAEIALRFVVRYAVSRVCGIESGFVQHAAGLAQIPLHGIHHDFKVAYIVRYGKVHRTANVADEMAYLLRQKRICSAAVPHMGKRFLDVMVAVPVDGRQSTRFTAGIDILLVLLDSRILHILEKLSLLFCGEHLVETHMDSRFMKNRAVHFLRVLHVVCDKHDPPIAKFKSRVIGGVVCSLFQMREEFIKFCRVLNQHKSAVLRGFGNALLDIGLLCRALCVKKLIVDIHLVGCGHCTGESFSARFTIDNYAHSVTVRDAKPVAVKLVYGNACVLVEHALGFRTVRSYERLPINGLAARNISCRRHKARLEGSGGYGFIDSLLVGIEERRIGFLKLHERIGHVSTILDMAKEPLYALLCESGRRDKVVKMSQFLVGKPVDSLFIDDRFQESGEILPPLLDVMMRLCAGISALNRHCAHKTKEKFLVVFGVPELVMPPVGGFIAE